MRVLMITEAYLPRAGGGVRYEVDWCKHLQKKGHWVDVLTVNDRNKLCIEKQPSGEIIRLPKHFHVDSAWISFNFPRWLTQNINKYDVVHFNAPNPGGELSFKVARLLTDCRPARVCSVHAEVVSTKRFSGLYNKWVFERHLESVDRIIVSSPNYYQSSLILPKFSKKIAIIPYGIDPFYFRMLAGKSPIDQARESSILALLFVGRFTHYKGLEHLISAMATAPGNLTVIGTGYLRTRLERQAQGLGLQDRIQFAGYATDQDLARAYAMADVIVLPSINRGESFGYVLAEAMSLETAAISTEIGSGTSFVNVHSETGLVVPPGNPTAIAEAICILDRDREMLGQFKLAARRRIEKLFNVRLMLERTESLYRKLNLAV